MAYRTLEEKFLADHEELERECAGLREKVGELEAKLEGQRAEGGNILIDKMVVTEGRKEVFRKYTKSWSIPETKDHEYSEWCIRLIDTDYADTPKIPKGISVNEFVTYFEKEFSDAYDKQYEREQEEED